MSSTSPRLGLVRPVTADSFQTSDHFNNLTLLDGFPGVFICTSGTRPGSWGAAHTGMLIFETDTSLMWRWNGTIFVRHMPVGLLGTTDLTTDFSTAATSATTAISCAVTVPPTTVGSTTKRIRVSGSWNALDNGTSTTLGACEVSLYRASTALKTLLWRGRPNTAASPLDWGMGGTIEAYDDAGGVAGGALTYTLRINSIASVGGTSTLRASAAAHAQLAVTETGL